MFKVLFNRSETNGSEKLIISIIDQAIIDAKRKCKYRYDRSMREDARIFLNSKNPPFKKYCELLGLDPEYAHGKIWAYINT